MILHSLLFGLLLGLGAAIPIGPMNLEIIRRNLTLGTRFGVAFGLGACSVDIIYLILLSFGMINMLTHPALVKTVTLIGSLILGWFAYSAFKSELDSKKSYKKSSKSKNHPLTHYGQGFMMTFINPITIIFWASISSQVTSLVHHKHGSILFAGIGVMLGTTSWVAFLNTVLKLTRHKFSDKAMLWINRIGGLILTGFAIAGITQILII